MASTLADSIPHICGEGPEVILGEGAQGVVGQREQVLLGRKSAEHLLGGQTREPLLRGQALGELPPERRESS